jgi:Ras-related protein Rab-8A
VTTAQGKALADEFGIKFFETSAKLNKNVDEAFMAIASDIVERLKENPEHYGSESGVNLGNGKKNQPGGCC